MEINKNHSCACWNSFNIIVKSNQIETKRSTFLSTESYPDLFAGVEHLRPKKPLNFEINNNFYENPKPINSNKLCDNYFIKPQPIKPYFPDENYNIPQNKKIIFCFDCNKKSIIIPSFCKKCLKNDIIVKQIPDNFDENNLNNYYDNYVCISCKLCTFGCNHEWETHKSAFFPNTISNIVCKICQNIKRD